MQEPRPPSLALLTDLYQLTMSYGYWKLGRSEQESIFHLFFRRAPFEGGYAIAAGLATAIEFLEAFQFDSSDIEYLATINGNDGKSLFEKQYLDYLSNLRLSVDVDAMPEGTLAFGHEPLLRIQGPILQCQLLETPLLNIINFQTLIATKASRIASAAGKDPVLEFGLRRAQGVDGALSASRAAYIGGCAATSNVMAGKKYGIPVKGTHAHSWVMSFDDELESFQQYANVMPNNCVFLVDTYDTLEGVRKAVIVGNKLRDSGHEMVGIRLDSGDLAELSIQARKILDESGFPNASIVASNDLDENAIQSLRRDGAQISVWGIGTKLSTAYDQPALGGVYKLGALRNEDGTWLHKIKLSEQAIKTSIPGKLQVRRYTADINQLGRALAGDIIYDELGRRDWDQSYDEVPSGEIHCFGIDGVSKHTIPSETANGRDLLRPMIRGGVAVNATESIHQIRDRAASELACYRNAARSGESDNTVKPSIGLEPQLNHRRLEMIQRKGKV